MQQFINAPDHQQIGHELIGRRVKVHWEDDECEPCKGVITQYSQEEDLYYIHYDDGDEEWEERSDFTLLVSKNNNSDVQKHKKFYAQPVPLVCSSIPRRLP